MCGCGGCQSIQQQVIKGTPGTDGASAYEIAVQGGFVGSEADWIASLEGADGQSAFDIWQAAGGQGGMEGYLASMLGTPGTNGQNGVSAFTHIVQPFPAFIQPSPGNGITIEVTTDPSWLSINMPVHVGGVPGNWYFVHSVNGYLVTLRNPGPADGYPNGIASNSPQGTYVQDTHMTARGRDGMPGAQGEPGTGLGTSDGIPSDPPDPDSPMLVLAVTGPAENPDTIGYYAWTGSAWTLQADATPKHGNKVMFLVGDPNEQPSNYGVNGDVVIDTSSQKIQKFYQKTAPGVWQLKYTFTGGPTGSSDTFRVGKAAPQPLTMTTDPQTVNFEDSTPPNHFNGGAWNGSSYVATDNPPTPQTFTVENFIISRENGSPDQIVDFLVEIVQDKGAGPVVLVSATLEMDTLDVKNSFAILTKSGVTVDPGDTHFVRVTPSVVPDAQWSIEAGARFYNQAVTPPV